MTECTIVMYHYVRDMHKTKHPNIKGLLIDKFRSQINYILKNYKVISIEDYVDFLNGKKKIPKNSCILSFDDGFKDHYTNVFPILKEKGITGCFFLLTAPLKDLKVSPTHKTHFLLERLGPKKFADEFNTVLKAKYLELYEEFKIADKLPASIASIYDDDPITTNLKRNIALLDFKIKTAILDEIFPKFFENEEEFCKELYMSWDEMKEMMKARMSFGGHTENHPILSELTEEEQLKELKESKKILEDNLNTKIITFAYPYGDFNETTIKLLKQLGYSCALTTEFRVNKGVVDAFKIGRFDTNEIPFK